MNETNESISFYNTLTKEKDAFTPLREGEVRMYSCGPTVYDYQHIGNLGYAVFVDIVKRALLLRNYSVQHVMNFTDFGHLTSDADEGEDKMAVGLKREGLEPTLENMRALGTTYADAFKEDQRLLGIDTESITYVRASDFIPAQIALIQTLEEKGYAYTTSDGVYYDIARFPSYGALGDVAEQHVTHTERMHAHPEKRDQRDFALWKFNEEIGWDSPWGKGAPGWHIECSAMAQSELGRQIDIHTGGIEHIGTHHNNEIAQSEAATGKKPFSQFWLHREHILVDGKKMSKSLGNIIYVRHITERGYSPLSYRYWLLTAHYKTPTNFTWEALEAAHAALKKLHRYFVDSLPSEEAPANEEYTRNFRTLIYDNLDTPKALALLWHLVKDDSVQLAEKRATLLYMDSVLALGLKESNTSMEILKGGEGQKLQISDIPKDVQQKVAEREKARAEEDFAAADNIRDELATLGYSVIDGPNGPEVSKK